MGKRGTFPFLSSFKKSGMRCSISVSDRPWSEAIIDEVHRLRGSLPFCPFGWWNRREQIAVSVAKEPDMTQIHPDHHNFETSDILPCILPEPPVNAQECGRVLTLCAPDGFSYRAPFPQRDMKPEGAGDPAIPAESGNSFLN